MTGIRERSREILRAELAEAAAAYCTDHGFDDVTVDELAQGIGVSRATFFRWFTSKEDAVVSASATKAGPFADFVAKTQVEPGELAWRMMRAASEPMVEIARARGDDLRARLRMIEATPSLRGRLAWERRSEQAAVTDVLHERLGDERLARAVAALSIAAIDLAWREWAHTPESELGALLDDWFEAVAGASAATIQR